MCIVKAQPLCCCVALLFAGCLFCFVLFVLFFLRRRGGGGGGTCFVLRSYFHFSFVGCSAACRCVCVCMYVIHVVYDVCMLCVMYVHVCSSLTGLVKSGLIYLRKAFVIVFVVAFLQPCVLASVRSPHHPCTTSVRRHAGAPKKAAKNFKTSEGRVRSGHGHYSAGSSC